MNQAEQQTLNQAIRIIKATPFTRGITLTGSHAENKATKNSDIDLFVQVKEGHIFSTRFFVTLFIHLVGIRRTDTDIAGKICLNWFATYDAPQQQTGRVYKALWTEAKINQPIFKKIFEWILASPILYWIEKVLKNYQIKRFVADPRTHQKGSQVRYSNTELGFHPPKQK